MAKFADPGETKPRPPSGVLRGPANADNYRVKVGRFGDRFYTDPLPADSTIPATPDDESYPSVSIVKKASGQDWTHVSLKRIARDDDLADLLNKGYFERYEKLKVINKLGLGRDQRRGTNVHTWAECLAYGIPPYLTSADEGHEWFPTVDRVWAELQPKLIAAEIVAFHRTLNGWGYGGTADGFFEIDGKVYIVDWKSRGVNSDHGCYWDEAAQLGAYAGAEYVIVDDDDESNPHGAKRIPVPHLDGGLIVSIKPDSYEVYPVDITEAIESFHYVHSWWVARRREREPIGRKWPPRRPVTPEPKPSDCPAGRQDAHQCDCLSPEEEALFAAEGHLGQDAGPIDMQKLRKDGLYARYDKLNQEQQHAFDNRIIGIDAGDLDAVEALLDEIENPPTTQEMAKQRMAEQDKPSADEVADSRLSAEGGEADPDDVVVFEARWELGMTDPGRKWTGKIVTEAIAANRDFRLSNLRSQRRADIYCALTEWATVDDFDWRDDTKFRGALLSATDDETCADVRIPLGEVIGNLTTKQASNLRVVVTEIANGRATYVIPDDADVAPRWVPIESDKQSESESA